MSSIYLSVFSPFLLTGLPYLKSFLKRTLNLLTETNYFCPFSCWQTWLKMEQYISILSQYLCVARTGSTCAFLVQNVLWILSIPKLRWFVHLLYDLGCGKQNIGSTADVRSRWASTKSACNKRNLNATGLYKIFKIAAQVMMGTFFGDSGHNSRDEILKNVRGNLKT